MSKKSGLMLELEKSVKKLLADVMKTPKDPKDAPSLTDKMKVIDRAIKLEALNQKLNDGAYGKGFFDDDDNDEGAET